MKPLPSIARQRLGAIQPGSHPDFGVLTAFVENSLERAQRESILCHLAACSRCNQLVALATPDKDEVLVQTGRKWRDAGFRPWRWVTGSALAGALATAAVFFVAMPHVTQLAPPVAQIAATSPQTAPQATTPQPATRSLQRPARTPSAAVHTPEVARANTAAGTDERISSHAADVTIQLPPSPSTENPLQPATSGTNTQVPPGMSSVAAPAAGPCWRASDAGALEKSPDCANSWASIALPEPVAVRVVQAVGNSVWVGGNSGALFTSSDAGQHWNKVHVAGLSGDVVAVVFGTPTHGWVSTANGEIWVTTDGGVTWKRR